VAATSSIPAGSSLLVPLNCFPFSGRSGRPATHCLTCCLIPSSLVSCYAKHVYTNQTLYASLFASFSSLVDSTFVFIEFHAPDFSMSFSHLHPRSTQVLPISSFTSLFSTSPHCPLPPRSLPLPLHFFNFSPTAASEPRSPCGCTRASLSEYFVTPLLIRNRSHVFIFAIDQSIRARMM
jgi:hypothetical protein